jgi:phosphate uptake regulator
MNIKVFIFNILAIVSNIERIATKSVNINNLVLNDFQDYLSNTQRSVRAYLSTILVDSLLHNVDVIFASHI